MAVTKYAAQGDASTVIQGDCTNPVVASCTDDATTTAQINMSGFAFGSVLNASASSVSVTYYAASTDGGTAYALVDQDGTAVTQTIAATTLAELPSACAGVAYLLPVTGSAATLTFTFKR